MANTTVLIQPNWDPAVIMTEQLVQIQNALACDGAESSDFDLNPDLILPEGRKLRAASVMVPLINHGDSDFEITRGMRIAQMVVAPVVQVQIEEVSELSDSQRGAGGFGSTGT